MTRAAWRGLGLLLLCAGTVVALVGAARMAPEAAAWRSRPHWPLFETGIFTLSLATLLIRLSRRGHHDTIDGAGSTTALFSQVQGAVQEIAAGRPARARPESPLPAALEVLTENEAPAEDAAYLLWLKLQLDPVLDELFPALFASREAFRKRQGLSAYAQVFSGLARAERLLLRSWSAAVDGYAGEARAALAVASAQLGQVGAELPGPPAARATIGE